MWGAVARDRVPIVVITVPNIPFMTHSAGFRDGWTSRIRPRLICQGLVFEDLQTQTGRNVKGDMAMYEPGPGIVGFEGNDDVSVLWHENYVSAWRIVSFWFHMSRMVSLVVSLLHDRKIVAVQVNLGQGPSGVRYKWILRRAWRVQLTG